MKQTNIIILLAVLFTSCGPSEQEKAQLQKRHDDSIATVIRAQAAQMQKQREDSLTKAVQEQTRRNIDLQEGKQNRLNALKKMLANAKADLDVANDEMKHIKEFHVGRTSIDREGQIRNQDLKIQAIEANIERINKAINDMGSQN